MRLSVRPAVPAWAWPSLLGLDAPAIAVAWSWALAHTAGASFTSNDAAVVGFATMAAYLLDRRLDVRSLGPDGSATLRHRWIARHPRLATALAAVAAIVAAAAAVGLPESSLAWGVVVAVGAALVVIAPGRRAAGVTAALAWPKLPRAVAVGAVFAAAAALPSTDGDWWSLAPALAGLALVAALNVRFIGEWERHRDDGAAATAPPSRVAGWLLAASLAIVLLVARPWLAGLGSALATASACLAVLDGAFRRSDAQTGRTPSSTVLEARHLAADLALIAGMVALPLG